MDIRPIRSDQDHAAALAEIERLWGAVPGSDDGDKLDVLATLVNAYEEQRWPVEAPDPISLLNQFLLSGERTREDFNGLIGTPDLADDVLARRRPLTVEMIHRIANGWSISADLLVRPYRLDGFEAA
ncbi:transcriptional regulator, XRE family [Fulvimarina manganoxydans]|uniref:Transcriptional regulator, XRE family n=1 Tax=Fulvimarina manganoxydans TaxID=937218 RepID=A0A1W2E987_9HYPH|nr:transcriptional regulator [Fulvimarina manganoxydans]SMD05618.1 transcriptional regulator, XRE family [Fulvimarina manganoxydans]